MDKLRLLFENIFMYICRTLNLMVKAVCKKTKNVEVQQKDCKVRDIEKTESGRMYFRVGLFAVDYYGPLQTMLHLEGKDRKIKESESFGFSTKSLYLCSKFEDIDLELFLMHDKSDFEAFENLTRKIDVFWMFFSETQHLECQEEYLYGKKDTSVLRLISQIVMPCNLIVLEISCTSDVFFKKASEKILRSFSGFDSSNLLMLRTNKIYRFPITYEEEWYENKKRGLTWIRDTLKRHLEESGEI